MQWSRITISPRVCYLQTNVYLIIIFFAFSLARISGIALLDKQSINSVTVQIFYLGQMSVTLLFPHTMQDGTCTLAVTRPLLTKKLASTLTLVLPWMDIYIQSVCCYNHLLIHPIFIMADQCIGYAPCERPMVSI